MNASRLWETGRNGSDESETPESEVRADVTLNLITLADFLSPPDSSPQLIEGLVPLESIVVVFGPAKSGKTFSVCDLAMHAAHGMHWHGHSVVKAMSVVFLAGEGRHGLKVRLKAWVEHHAAELRGDFQILPVALSLPRYCGRLLAVLRGIQPDIIVVDTLNAYFGSGDENATQDMTAFVAAVRSLRDKLRCSVVVIHHTGHAEVIRERGSSVLRGAADVIVHVARDDKGSGLVAFQVIDARDMEPWPAPLSLRLSPFETEWTGGDGKRLGTCVVVAGDQSVSLPGRSPQRLGAAQASLLQIARELAEHRAPLSSGEVLLERAEVNRIARERKISRQSISSAWDSLASRGEVRLVGTESVAICLAP
jgi:KaiC/GvpD/RAD55 family RecA-like ATPase